MCLLCDLLVFVLCVCVGLSVRVDERVKMFCDEVVYRSLENMGKMQDNSFGPEDSVMMATKKRELVSHCRTVIGSGDSRRNINILETAKAKFESAEVSGIDALDKWLSEVNAWINDDDLSCGGYVEEAACSHDVHHLACDWVKLNENGKGVCARQSCTNYFAQTVCELSPQCEWTGGNFCQLKYDHCPDFMDTGLCIEHGCLWKHNGCKTLECADAINEGICTTTSGCFWQDVASNVAAGCRNFECPDANGREHVCKSTSGCKYTSAGNCERFSNKCDDLSEVECGKYGFLCSWSKNKCEERMCYEYNNEASCSDGAQVKKGCYWAGATPGCRHYCMEVVDSIFEGGTLITPEVCNNISYKAIVGEELITLQCQWKFDWCGVLPSPQLRF